MQGRAYHGPYQYERLNPASAASCPAPSPHFLSAANRHWFLCPAPAGGVARRNLRERRKANPGPVLSTIAAEKHETKTVANRQKPHWSGLPKLAGLNLKFKNEKF
jgi:hypothetical protein